ncbi:lysophospholipid acyltransferase family protein [Natranaerobius thermophilus]|uniref:Phospholipid/glycerol acyltransferase n=1 Tax=Natranaerobius thermophilus (strain ATCC BAA-1301 / DSM 18059 / JW/NM-WN-LF) TaxID=457570 RepID=B2A4N8_NATTJ|nr:lysophospholipid acyltransferase family protein [Natranaerobius thermophilus]ACB85213.1 phospholipid/glycerol acyltransferase [Natranaerobius thermophilus JW/NM-WN-LF]
MENKRTSLYIVLRFLFRLLFKVVYPIKLEGKQNLPHNGPAIICSNHISLLDPILLGCISEPHVTFMAKEELFNIPVIGRIIYLLGALPVKRGQVDRNAIKLSLKQLSKNCVFGIFPEGTRHSEDKKPLKGVGFLAARSKAHVVPVTIIGPYRLFRKTRVVVHQPVNYDELDFAKSEDPLLGFSQYIMDTINSELN